MPIVGQFVLIGLSSYHGVGATGGGDARRLRSQFTWSRVDKPVVAYGQLNGFGADQVAAVVVLRVGQVMGAVLREVAQQAGVKCLASAA